MGINGHVMLNRGMPRFSTSHISWYDPQYCPTMTRLSLSILACMALSGCAQSPNMAATGPNTPGWTGQTVVPGNNSTLAGNAEATYEQQKWPLGGRR
jgi:hypothetical protein